MQRIGCIVGLLGGFTTAMISFNIPMCEIMFNLEDQYLTMNPRLLLYLKKMFNKGFVKHWSLEKSTKKGYLVCS